MKLGSASEISMRSISWIELSISTPTSTRAPVVAAEGMSRKSGERKSARMKSTAVDSAVIPVRPPSAIPAPLSTKVVTVDVPQTAPMEVARASAIIACLMFFTLPSLSIISVLAAAPMSVPTVLKISMKTRAKIVSAISMLSSALKSNCRNVGASERGRETGMKLSGICVTPRGIPMIVQRTML